MQIRNPIYTRTGLIDCEVQHPVYGWIPFTASPDDTEAKGRAIYAAALALGPAPAPAYVPPTAAQLDARAAAEAAEFFDADKRTAALGLVMADLIERAFGVSQSVARQQVKDRFRAYYRSLLG